MIPEFNGFLQISGSQKAMSDVWQKMTAKHPVPLKLVEANWKTFRNNVVNIRLPLKTRQFDPLWMVMDLSRQHPQVSFLLISPQPDGTPDEIRVCKAGEVIF